MSANDIRELENLDRIPEELGGDLYLINGNMLPLARAGAFADKNTEETEENTNENSEVLEVDEESGGHRENPVPQRHKAILPSGSIHPAVTVSRRHKSTIC